MTVLQKSLIDSSRFLTLKHVYYTPFRNMILGAGLGYAVQQESYYMHVPLVVLFPSVYAGYHTFNNRYAIGDCIRKYINIQ